MAQAGTVFGLPVKKEKEKEPTPEELEQLAADLPHDDPRLLFAVPKYTDVHTSIVSLDGLAALKSGVVDLHVWNEPAAHWLAVKADAKTTPRLLQGSLTLDKFHSSLQYDGVVALDKKKKKQKVAIAIPVANIKEIRPNHVCQMLPEDAAHLPAGFESELLVTLVHGESTMDINFTNIIAGSRAQQQLLLTGLNALARTVRATALNPTLAEVKARYIRLTGQDAPIPFGDLVQALGGDKSELKKLPDLLAHLQIPFDKKKKTVPKDALSFTHFQSLLVDFEHRTDLEQVYNIVKGSEVALTIPQFSKFLHVEQGYAEDLEPSLILALIVNNEPNPEFTAKGTFSLEGFMNFLLSRDGHIFNTLHLAQYQSMSEPLSQYFIASSHNTYLTGHQLVGHSSEEMYIQVLLEGCRCLELDLWDGPDGQPIIYHGFTLTTKIKAEAAIKVVKEYAFVTSQYPVILSLEDHLCLEQQSVLATMLKAILGDLLVELPEDEHEAKTWHRVTNFLPSPNDLKKKILIKHKKLPPAVVEQAAPTPSVASIAKMLVEEEIEDPDVADADLVDEDEPPPPPPVEVDPKAKKSKKKDEPPPPPVAPKHSSSTDTIDPALSALVIYTEAKKFKNFHTSAALKFSQMHSFAEPKAMKFAEKFARPWMHMNVRMLSRVYPKGSRIDSSNYNPMPAWNAGAQLVALNYQTPDEHWLLNRAMFKRNGNTGYILKPKPMRLLKGSMNPNGTAPVPGIPRVTLNLTVISGQHLHREKPLKMPCKVTVEIIGQKADCAVQSTGEQVGVLPTWNTVMSFEKIRLFEHAFIKFSVQGLGFPAVRILPLASVLPGYRHVALRTERDTAIVFSEIFVHVQLIEHLDEMEGPPRTPDTARSRPVSGGVSTRTTSITSKPALSKAPTADSLTVPGSVAAAPVDANSSNAATDGAN